MVEHFSLTRILMKWLSWLLANGLKADAHILIVIEKADRDVPFGSCRGILWIVYCSAVKAAATVLSGSGWFLSRPSLNVTKPCAA